MAFLPRISSSAVQDYQRAASSDKRRGQVVPIETARAAELAGGPASESPEFASSQLGANLSWIDVEPIVEGDPDRKKTREELHSYSSFTTLTDFSPARSGGSQGFEPTKSGVETILRTKEENS